MHLDRVEMAVQEDRKEVKKQVSKIDSRVTALGRYMQQKEDERVALSKQVSLLVSEWPTIGEQKKLDKGTFREVVDKQKSRAEQVTGNKNSQKESKVDSDSVVSLKGQERAKMSCAERLRTCKKTVMVMGDSMARGVGGKLKQNSGSLMSTRSRGGATIEKLTREITELKDDSSRYLVVMVGTNNLENDSVAEILEKYDKLIETCKQKQNCKVSVVGITKRYDLKQYFETKRIVVNRKLKEKCCESEIDYIEYDPELKKMARDRLHLNEAGQEELAQKVFKQFMHFLLQKNVESEVR